MSDQMIDTTDLAQRLAVALDAHSKAKPARAEDNPLHTASLDDVLASTSVRKYADLLPQQDKHGNWLGPDVLNEAVVEGLAARRNKQKARRAAQARAKAQRKAQIDAITMTPTQPSPERLTDAWAVIRPLVPTISRIARAKGAWARRYLGAVADDVAHNAMTSMALVLAKSDYDLEVYKVAAAQLADEAERTQRIPGNQANKKSVRAEAKARGWLMGMVNNRVMGALCDAYTERHNLKWDNLDIIETVMASISGVGEDPLAARHQADKAPHFVASRLATPGVIDPMILRAAIAGAITDRRLDLLVETLTHEDNLNSDGSFRWTANAEAILRSMPDGEYRWHAVEQATAHHADPAHSRASLARLACRKEFAFLPWLIASIVESCTPERVGWRDGRALMASAFDPDAFAADGSRKRAPYAQPVLVFEDAAHAARVIAETISTILADVRA